MKLQKVWYHTKVKILVVDDDESIAELVSILLSDYNPQIVNTFVEANNLLAAQNFDLLITDFHLESGFTSEPLLAQASKANIPAILMSAGLSQEEVVTFLKKYPSIVSFISKPFSTKELLSIVNRLT